MRYITRANFLRWCKNPFSYKILRERGRWKNTIFSKHNIQYWKCNFFHDTLFVYCRLLPLFWAHEYAQSGSFIDFLDRKYVASYTCVQKCRCVRVCLCIFDWFHSSVINCMLYVFCRIYVYFLEVGCDSFILSCFTYCWYYDQISLCTIRVNVTEYVYVDLPPFFACVRVTNHHQFLGFYLVYDTITKVTFGPQLMCWLSLQVLIARSSRPSVSMTFIIRSGQM